jgi:transcriptional regulator with XRE-family HTH domain
MSYKGLNLGAAVRRFREERGLHAKELASAAGISASYLSEIENGKRPVSLPTLRKLARHFGLAEIELEEILKRLNGFGESSQSGSFPDKTAAVSPPPAESREAAVPYHSRIPPNSETPDDITSLARWFVDSLDREKAFEIVHQMTDNARKGDAKAAGIARALLLLLTYP